jgi:regulator of replication initiation timing
MDLQNYHDWIIERQRLLERIKELEAENTKLKKRLGEDVTSVVHEPTAMQKLSAQEKVELFRSLFKGLWEWSLVISLLYHCRVTLGRMAIAFL